MLIEVLRRSEIRQSSNQLKWLEEMQTTAKIGYVIDLVMRIGRVELNKSELGLAESLGRNSRDRPICFMKSAISNRSTLPWMMQLDELVWMLRIALLPCRELS